MDQIAFAVIAATISVIAVFLPLAFLTDKTGRLFREFGITVAGAVGISGIVAPHAVADALRARAQAPRREERGQGGARARLRPARERVRRGAAARAGAPRALRPVGVGWVGLGFLLLGWMDREFIPTADRGIVLTFTRAPEGSTLAHTDRYQKMAEDMALTTPEVDRTFSVVSLGFGVPGQVNEGGMFTSLKLWEERSRSQMQVVDELRGRFFRIPASFAFPINPSPFSSTFGAQPVSLVVQGPDVEELATYSAEIVKRAQALPGVVNLQTDLRLNKPQLEVHIDRDRASDLGMLRARDRHDAPDPARRPRSLDLQARRRDLRRHCAARERTSARSREISTDCTSIGAAARWCRSPRWSDVRESVSPRGLPHFDRLRAATITASLVQGVPLGSALETLRGVAEGVLAGAPAIT
jgi:multidrug efflux pump subunit AcrB